MPAADVIVYAYQTDATGEYHNDPKTRVARLHGWAKTDAQGRYLFHTIKPASYPRMNIPAHVHLHVWGLGYPLQWTPELEFAGDKFLKPDQIAASNALGTFASGRRIECRRCRRGANQVSSSCDCAGGETVGNSDRVDGLEEETVMAPL